MAAYLNSDPEQIFSAFADFLDNDSPKVRIEAVKYLADLGGQRAIVELRRLKNDPDEEVALAAIRAINSIYLSQEATDATYGLQQVAKILSDSKAYDTVLTHNTRDKQKVEKICSDLKERGIEAWFDRWDLNGGDDFKSEFERVSKQVMSACICCGCHGLGQVQEQFELPLLEFEAKRRKLRLIPVVLDSLLKEHAPAFPDNVNRLTWVDFREESPDPLENLINAIKKNNEPPMN